MDKIFEWFGKSRYIETLNRINSFWEGNERFIISVNSSKGDYRKLYDPDKMTKLAPVNLESQSLLPGLNMPSFFADFGTISTAKYWGGEFHFDSSGSYMYIDPVANTIEEVLELKPLPIEHKDMDAAMAIELFTNLNKKLNTESLWLRMPDFQGPLNTAGLIMNQENLFLEMYTNPDGVFEYLSLVTKFLIDYAKFFYKKTNNKVCGYIWPYTFFPCDIGLAVTEDVMPLISAELYQEFGIPTLKTLGEEFGSLQIHCCGEWGRHAKALKNSGIKIKAVEFHYPYTKIEEIECLASDTIFIPYIGMDQQSDFKSVTEYFDYLLNSTDKKFRFWFAFPDDNEEAINYAKKYGF